MAFLWALLIMVLIFFSTATFVLESMPAMCCGRYDRYLNQSKRLAPDQPHGGERILYWQPTGPNPLDHRDDFSRPALRHGRLNSLFMVAFYLLS